MLSSGYSHCLARRPLLSPPCAPRLGVSARARGLCPLARGSRVSYSYTTPSYVKNGWKISCFRHDGPSPETPIPDFVEHLLPEDSMKPEQDKSVLLKKVWKTKFREAADGMVGAIGRPWSVPWKAETVLLVMVLWVSTFWFIGTWAVPFVVHIAGFNKESLSFRGQALYSLLTDVAEAIAGISILRCCLSRFQPFPSDWFTFRLKGRWHLDLALGCLMFPLVTRLSQFNLDILPLLPSTPLILSSVEQSIQARDPVAMTLYAVVVTICAPVWEEIVFRGFLLPSLTRYMPVWCAILVSSVAFALAHFSVQRMLPLIFLGIVMGVLFTRSRNLVPSMLLHSLWNAFVFISLMR